MLSGGLETRQRTMKESDCKVTDSGSRVQRVLIQSVDKVEKDTVTLNEEKSENSCGDEDYDVQRVPAIPKNPYHSEIHRRNIRDNLRVEIDVRTIVTKNTLSVMAKLMITCRCEGQEAKQLLNNANMPGAKKVQALWRKLQSEDELARSVTEDSHAKIRQRRHRPM